MDIYEALAAKKTVRAVDQFGNWFKIMEAYPVCGRNNLWYVNSLFGGKFLARNWRFHAT